MSSKQKITVMIDADFDQASFASTVDKMQKVIGSSTASSQTKSMTGRMAREAKDTLEKIEKLRSAKFLNDNQLNDLSRLTQKFDSLFKHIQTSFNEIEGPDFSSSLKEQIEQYDRALKSLQDRINKTTKEAAAAYKRTTGKSFNKYDEQANIQERLDSEKLLADLKRGQSSDYYKQILKDEKNSRKERILAEKAVLQTKTENLNTLFQKTAKEAGAEGKFKNIDDFAKKKSEIDDAKRKAEVAVREAKQTLDNAAPEQVKTAAKKLKLKEKELLALKEEKKLIEQIEAKAKTLYDSEGKSEIGNIVGGNQTSFGSGQAKLEVDKKRLGEGTAAIIKNSTDAAKKKLDDETEATAKRINSLKTESQEYLKLKQQIDAVTKERQEEINALEKSIVVEKQKQSGTFAEDQKDAAESTNKATEAIIRQKKAIDDQSAVLNRNKLAYESLGGGIGNALDQLKMLIGIGALLRGTVNIIKQSVQTVRALDDEITQIGIVTGRTTEDIWSMFNTFNSEAKKLSTTTKQYLEGAKIFYQQGLKTKQVMEMVKATTISAALGETDFTTASETLTAAINGYEMEASAAMEVTDKMAAVGAKSAADFNELSTSMTKVASAAYTAGIDFDHLMGFLAKGIETTREAPEAYLKKGAFLKSVA